MTELKEERNSERRRDILPFVNEQFAKTNILITVISCSYCVSLSIFFINIVNYSGSRTIMR